MAQRIQTIFGHAASRTFYIDHLLRSVLPCRRTHRSQYPRTTPIRPAAHVRQFSE